MRKGTFIFGISKSVSILVICCLGALPLQAQDFMMQGWVWGYPYWVNGNRYIKHLETELPELSARGFTYLWVPPLSYASGGINSMGYDVADYYDLSQYRNARWGTRQMLSDFIQAADANGIKAVADVVYNHRDAGVWEDNPAVEGWMENMNATKIAQGDQPFPSNRVRCYLPLGGTSGNGAGTYYFKMRSASQAAVFNGRNYVFQTWTNTRQPNNVIAIVAESEPNGGGDCAQANNTIPLTQRISASIDAGGCGIDEFAVTIAAGDFDPAGDRLYFQFYNTNSSGGGADLGQLSDHLAIGIWNGAASQNVVNQVKFQTRTNHFPQLSGRGGMDWRNFKPNGNATQLSGDLDAMLFYYDVDHTVPSTRDTLFEFTRWMWDEVGARGFRVDAVKHFQASFMGDLLDYLHDQGIDPSMIVGESFDFNPAVLKGWIDQVQASMDADTRAAINIRIFDFALRNALNNACNTFGYDARNVFNSSVVDGAGGSGFNVVTFVNNHDFRPGEPNGPLTNDPHLAYAYILTNNQLGTPCVYYGDYYPNNLLRARINALMEVHRRYIFGATGRDYLNRIGSGFSSNFSSGYNNASLIYQLRNAPSGKDVVVVINFAGETLRVTQQLNTANLVQGDTLTDILGVSPNAFTLVNNNTAYFEVPARSFGVWVKGDLTQSLIPIDTTFTSVQQFETNTASLGIMAYPNPSNGKLMLQIDATQAGQATLEVYNLAGQLLQSNNIELQANTQAIELPDTHKLTAGTYFLKLKHQGQVATERIIRY